LCPPLFAIDLGSVYAIAFTGRQGYYPTGARVEQGATPSPLTQYNNMSSKTGKSSAPRSLSRVHFDVGGKQFWTRPETLQGSGKLKALYEKVLRSPHSDGSIDGQSFSVPIRIDRDWTEFKEILGYLRDPRYPIEPEWEYALLYWDIAYEGLFEDVDSDDDGSEDSLSDFSDTEDADDTEPERGRSPVRRPPPTKTTKAK
jgi:hypothetical protein